MDYPIIIGEATIVGAVGDSVALQLAASAGLLAGAGPSARVDIAVAGHNGAVEMRGVSLDALEQSVVVYRFTAGSSQIPDTVRLTYSLPRLFGSVNRNETVRLTQIVNSARVIEWRAEWGSRATSLLTRAIIAAPEQGAASEPGVYNGITVGISPYFPGFSFGAFESTPDNTTASVPITITFDKPVMQVTVTIEDPTFPGNTITAYDSAGNLVGMDAFDPSGRPGHNIPSVKTVGVGKNNIVRVVLAAAPADYVAYDAIRFERDTTCGLFKDPSKVTDALLKDPLFQAQITQLIQDTKWDKPLREQVENGGLFMEAPDGTRSFFPYDNGGEQFIPPGPCLSAISRKAIDSLVLGQGFKILAQVHTHPRVNRSEPDPGNCYNLQSDFRGVSLVHRPTDIFGRLEFPPGPSRVDMEPWRKGDKSPSYPGYVIEPSGITTWSTDANGLHQQQFDFSDCARAIKATPPPPPPQPTDN